MRAMEATVVWLFVSSLALAGLACKRTPRTATRPPDAGMLVTVYVAPKVVAGVMGRLQGIAAQHQWALSVRTDSAALADADLVIVDSSGTVVGRLRPGSAAAAQAKAMADAVLP